MARCPGTRRKVAPRARKAGVDREIRCPSCGRTVAVNYDGTIRHHVDKLKRGK